MSRFLVVLACVAIPALGTAPMADAFTAEPARAGAPQTHTLAPAPLPGDYRYAGQGFSVSVVREPPPKTEPGPAAVPESPARPGLFRRLLRSIFGDR